MGFDRLVVTGAGPGCAEDTPHPCVKMMTAIMIFLAVLVGHASAGDRANQPFWQYGRVQLLPKFVADYAAAMGARRDLLLETTSPDHRVDRLLAPKGIRWRWRAADGSTVQRIGEGLFRLTVGDCVNRMCTETDCAAGGWPIFVCGDGRSRKMSAPDDSTIIFDGVTFSRILVLDRDLDIKPATEPE